MTDVEVDSEQIGSSKDLYSGSTCLSVEGGGYIYIYVYEYSEVLMKVKDESWRLALVFSDAVAYQ
jgi:hypothetical protein